MPKAQLGSWGKGSSGGAKASEIGKGSAHGACHSWLCLPGQQGAGTKKLPLVGKPGVGLCSEDKALFSPRPLQIVCDQVPLA